MEIKTLKRLPVLLSLLVSGAALAADQPTMVLSDLHHANQMEIHMGTMARDKAQSADVKAYGEKLVKDHQDADDQVLSLAKKDGLSLEPASDEGMMAKHEASMGKKKMTSLSEKSGADFDKAFAKMMISDHKKDIAKLEKADQTLQQADVKALVEKLLPTLKEHLAIAEKLASNS